jgi:hypothetical protein
VTQKERPAAGGDRAVLKACINKRDCAPSTNKSPKPQTENTERRFGALVVIRFSDSTLKRCLCRCSCGTVVQISVEALTAGEILNCGNCRQAPQAKRHKSGAA